MIRELMVRTRAALYFMAVLAVVAACESTPQDPTVESISITPESLNLPLQSQIDVREKFKVTATMSDGSVKDVTPDAIWPDGAKIPEQLELKTSTSPTINALLIARKTGTVLIDVSFGGKTKQVTITVVAETATAFRLEPSVLALAKGDKQALKVFASFESGEEDVTQSAVFSGLNEDIAKILTESVNEVALSAIAPGATRLNVAFTPLPAKEIGVTVSPAVLREIEIQAPKVFVTEAKTLQLTAIGRYSDSELKDVTAALTWEVLASADGVVHASVGNEASDKGLVKGLIPGDIVVKAFSSSVPSVQNTFEVTVTPKAPTSVSLNSTSIALVSNGTTQLSAIAHYDGQTSVSLTQGVTFELLPASTAAATIDASGVLTATSVGDLRVVARYEGAASAPLVLSVHALKITVGQNNAGLIAGLSGKLQVTLNDEYAGNLNVASSYDWTSSGGNITLTKDENGVTISVDAEGPFSLMARKDALFASQGFSAVKATSLSASPGQVVLAQGQSQQLVVEARMDSTVLGNVTAHVDCNLSRQTPVISVTKDCQITANSVGTAKVAITPKTTNANGLHTSVDVSVTVVAVSGSVYQINGIQPGNIYTVWANNVNTSLSPHLKVANDNAFTQRLCDTATVVSSNRIACSIQAEANTSLFVQLDTVSSSAFELTAVEGASALSKPFVMTVAPVQQGDFIVRDMSTGLYTLTATSTDGLGLYGNVSLSLSSVPNRQPDGPECSNPIPQIENATIACSIASLNGGMAFRLESRTTYGSRDALMSFVRGGFDSEGLPGKPIMLTASVIHRGQVAARGFGTLSSVSYYTFNTPPAPTDGTIRNILYKVTLRGYTPIVTLLATVPNSNVQAAVSGTPTAANTIEVCVRPGNKTDINIEVQGYDRVYLKSTAATTGGTSYDLEIKEDAPSSSC